MRLRRGLLGWRPRKRRLTPAERDTAEQLRLERETARLQNRHAVVQAESPSRRQRVFRRRRSVARPRLSVARHSPTSPTDAVSASKP